MTEQIHASERQLVVAITGGGSKAISQLLDVAGASRSVLEAVVPYADAALAAWLGSSVDRSCSEPTARAMAMASWMRARRLAPEADPQQLVGIGATASLASDRPKRGEHRVHVAMQTATHTASCSLQLSKGSRDRKKEQWLAAKLILLQIGEACQVNIAAVHDALASQLVDGEQIYCCRQPAVTAWSEVLLGQVHCQTVSPRPVPETTTVRPQILFPGAFNPPHVGHRRMAEFAAAKLGQPVAFELSITNVDKLPLDFVQLHKRIKTFEQWNPTATLLLTDAPTFVAKSAHFAGCTFVVGADTIARIADLRYYDNNLAARDAAIQTIAEQQCRFLVFGRNSQNGFQELRGLTIPETLRTLCAEVSQQEFREDISSTSLR